MKNTFQFFNKRITGRQICLGLISMCILYAGHATYNDIIIQQSQRILPEKIDNFMHSGTDYVLVSEIVKLRWDSVCIKRNEKINFLIFFLEKDQIATLSFDSKLFRFIDAPTEQTDVPCSKRSKAIFRKYASGFYFSELTQ